MDFFEGFLTLEMTVLIVAVFVPLIAAIYLYIYDRRQKQHSVLRNYPILGKVRYFLEMIGPELRQYLFDSDNEARPFSREQYSHIVKRSKYVRDVIGFGSKRDFDRAGYYIRNAMFPLQLEEMKFDRKTTVSTYKYVLLREGLFSRKEVRVPGRALRLPAGRSRRGRDREGLPASLRRPGTDRDVGDELRFPGIACHFRPVGRPRNGPGDVDEHRRGRDLPLPPEGGCGSDHANRSGIVRRARRGGAA